MLFFPSPRGKSYRIRWKKTENKGCYAVQGHSRSSRSVPVKSPYATSYQWKLQKVKRKLAGGRASSRTDPAADGGAYMTVPRTLGRLKRGSKPLSNSYRGSLPLQYEVKSRRLCFSQFIFSSSSRNSTCSQVVQRVRWEIGESPFSVIGRCRILCIESALDWFQSLNSPITRPLRSKDIWRLMHKSCIACKRLTTVVFAVDQIFLYKSAPKAHFVKIKSRFQLVHI